MSSGFSVSKSVEPAAGKRWFNAGRFLFGLRRINLFAGGYGSGKSEVAVNFALSLAEQGKRVSIADLDVVNPYFRSREARTVLKGFGINVLVPPEEVMATDLPMVQPEIKGEMLRGDSFVVIDLGGDPVGARVMASIASGIDTFDINVFFVLNSRRPFTSTVKEVSELMKGIENSSGLPITHIVVNSHLIEETSGAIIKEGIELAERVGAVTGKPIGFVAVEQSVLEDFDFNDCPYPVLVLRRLLLKPWEGQERLGPQREGI
jgi:hypothetical protein